MAALTSIALAAGVASMGYGMYESSQGRGQMEQGYKLQQQGSAIQAEAARQQAGISKEQAATSVEFAGQERDVNILASNQSIDASNASFGIVKDTIAQERAIETQKMRAMEVDARRQQLEIIRQQQRGRALALTNATSQGARYGSGLQGGYGQIGGQTGVNILGVQQNLEIGRNIFGFNENISNNRVAQSELEHTYSLQQAANQTAKANLTYGLASANAGYQTRMADTQTLMSQGQGLVNQGQGITSMGQSRVQSGQQFFNAGPQIFSMGTNANQLLGGGMNMSNGPGFNAPIWMRMMA